MSQKRNLPSWMSSRDPEISSGNSHSKKPKDDRKVEHDEQIKEHNNSNASSSNSKHGKWLPEPTEFSKLMVCVPISCC